MAYSSLCILFIYFFTLGRVKGLKEHALRNAECAFCSSIAYVLSNMLPSDAPFFFFSLIGERIRFNIAVGSVAYNHVASHQKVNSRRRGWGPEVNCSWYLWHAA